jgi:hypothetical protein
MAPEIAYIDFTPSELLTQRMHARLAREALRRAAHHHLYVRMGKHFREEPETAPGGGYGYEKRGERYEKQKLKRFGHRRPNDRTGKLKKQIRANSTITATQHRSRLLLRGYFPLTEQRRSELEAITPAERSEIQHQAHQFYLEEANKPENQRQRAPKQRIT